MTIFLAGISIIISIYADSSIIANNYSPVLIYWWLASIIIFLLAFGRNIKSIHFQIKPVKKKMLLILLLSLPALIRISNYNLSRIHGDDLITAYFSATEKFSGINFFGGIPTDKAQWVSQFPTPFFVLQKFFFMIFGENLLAIKLSVVPYILIVSVMLFLIVKHIFNIKTALVSLILYSFFPISLYLETLGLHFISSTAVFMVFFYFILLNFRQNSRFLAVLTGISCGFCYLFYNTSFIAFPLTLFIFAIQIIKLRKISVITNLIIALIGFSIVMGPYIGYITKHGNYFTSRMEQVSLLTGSWSNAKNRITKGEKTTLIIKENLLLSVRSLYQNGIGGHGGYTFANLAFLEKYSLYIFLIGLGLSLSLFKKIEILFIYLILALSFFMMALSTPPPAYHRLALSFPFLVIILSIPFYILFSSKRTSYKIRYFLIFIFILIYVFTSQRYFLMSVSQESNNANLKLASYVNKNFPDRNLRIASFPGFHFEKIYYFSEMKNAITVGTRYHQGYLDNFNPDEKYVYVIIFPNDFNSKFQEKDPNGKIFKFDDYFSLFVNE